MTTVVRNIFSFQLPDGNVWLSKILPVDTTVVDLPNNMLVVQEMTIPHNRPIQ